MSSQATLEARIRSQFGDAPYLTGGPAPPVGTVVQFHTAVETGPFSLDLRPAAAVVLENTRSLYRGQGEPLVVKLRVFSPSGGDEVVDAEMGDRPFPGYWTLIADDPQAVNWRTWHRLAR